MGQVRGNRWTSGVAHPVGVVCSSSAALLVRMLVLAGPVAQHGHGNPHHENDNSDSSHQTGRRAQVELPFHHHHIILLLFFGFPLPLVFRSVLGAEGILAPVHAQQAPCGYHGGDGMAGLSLNLAGDKSEKTGQRVNSVHDKPKVLAYRTSHRVNMFISLRDYTCNPDL